MKRLTEISILLAALAIPSAVSGQEQHESFDEFRKSILDGYESHRSEILSQYGKFLDGLWLEYPQYAGVPRNPFPKPPVIPVVADEKKPHPADDTPPNPEPLPDIGDVTVPPQPLPDAPTPKDIPETISIPFYGMTFSMRDVDYEIPDNLSRKNASDLWQYMFHDDVDTLVVNEIKALAKKLNLNDYLTFELTRSYVDTKFKRHTPFSRDVLKHFLLVSMGYDARLAETGSGSPMLLIPFKQMVYSRPFLNINDKKYFAFSDTPLDKEESIYTCFLPTDIALGSSFELKLNELNIPYKPYKYNITYGGISLSGEVNANIYPILHRYPQMPIGDYAQSVVRSTMRRNIVDQFEKALANDSRRSKAEKLLRFTQYAFDYATDDDNHGFEKPYFLEEMVYYLKCDCEDRAIFYSYLLHNVAGIENHIISYPGHEATALTLPDDDLRGTSYDHGGKKFFISDPTYIGASIGMCMPDFLNTAPTIDYIYPQK